MISRQNLIRKATPTSPAIRSHGDVLEDGRGAGFHLRFSLGRRDGPGLAGLPLLEHFVDNGVEDGDKGEDPGGVCLEVEGPAHDDKADGSADGDQKAYEECSHR